MPLMIQIQNLMEMGLEILVEDDSIGIVEFIVEMAVEMDSVEVELVFAVVPVLVMKLELVKDKEDANRELVGSQRRRRGCDGAYCVKNATLLQPSGLSSRIRPRLPQLRAISHLSQYPTRSCQTLNLSCRTPASNLYADDGLDRNEEDPNEVGGESKRFGTSYYSLASRAYCIRGTTGVDEGLPEDESDRVGTGRRCSSRPQFPNNILRLVLTTSQSEHHANMNIVGAAVTETGRGWMEIMCAGALQSGTTMSKEQAEVSALCCVPEVALALVQLQSSF
ncbi:hypothetical protein BT96DRAFT_1020813 [Gymnopus androsaceus JB14]|uniref:Uncharacterized protein n=1 Tax=Gymnopus androsaceus JB14 TaxID=1447944 RepID=A0A6A4HIT9_9AGAR|nr:hypothetical protein BT96DRAFT_1020813 [Gymnopus androsaceus JB14]